MLLRVFTTVLLALCCSKISVVAAEEEDKTFDFLQSAPLGRWQHCSVHCPKLDLLVVMGGLQRATPQSPLASNMLVYDFKSENWIDLGTNNFLYPIRTCELGVISETETSCTVVAVHSGVGEDNMGVVKVDLEQSGDTVTTEWSNIPVSSTRNINGRPSGPSRRVLFCSTFHENRFYIYGGFSEDVVFRGPWQLEITSTNSSQIEGTWNLLQDSPLDHTSSDGSDPGKIFTCAMAAADVQGSTKVYLYGGESYLDGSFDYNSALWTFDVQAESWTQTTPIVPLVRLYHSLVAAGGKLYSYGGLVPSPSTTTTQPHYFPTGVLQATLEGADYQQDCAPQSEPGSAKSDDFIEQPAVGLWCQYKEEGSGKNPSPGYAGSSCTLRGDSTLVCSFGASNRKHDSVSRRVLVVNLPLVSENLELVEKDVIPSAVFGSIYFFFALLSVTIAFVCIVGARDRRRWQQGGGAAATTNNQRPESRAASPALVSSLPLVEYHPVDSVSPSGFESAVVLNGDEGGVTGEGGLNHERDRQSNRERNEQNMCPICLCDYEAGEQLKLLPCDHQFHVECIDRWLFTDKACPMCKQDVDAVLKNETSSEGNSTDSPEEQTETTSSRQSLLERVRAFFSRRPSGNTSDLPTSAHDTTATLRTTEASTVGII